MRHQQIHEAIRSKLKSEETSLVGLVGLPGSGKSTLSRVLALDAKYSGLAAIPWEGDIYSTSSRENRTEIIRQEFYNKLNEGLPIDPDWPRKAYDYNIPLLVEHLAKLKNRTSFSAGGLCHPKRKSLDLEVAVDFSDKEYVNLKIDGECTSYDGKPTWFIVDWALLTKNGIKERLDRIVYVKADYFERAARIRRRLSGLPLPLILDEDLFKSIEESQVRDFNIKEEVADIIIDNNDYNNPKIVKF
jgi:dephospho-CoA kinase